jgi:hypothetical protein
MDIRNEFLMKVDELLRREHAAGSDPLKVDWPAFLDELRLTFPTATSGDLNWAILEISRQLAYNEGLAVGRLSAYAPPENN